MTVPDTRQGYKPARQGGTMRDQGGPGGTRSDQDQEGPNGQSQHASHKPAASSQPREGSKQRPRPGHCSYSGARRVEGMQ